MNGECQRGSTVPMQEFYNSGNENVRGGVCLEWRVAGMKDGSGSG